MFNSTSVASSSSSSSANNHLSIKGVGAPEAAKLYQDLKEKAYEEVKDGLLYKLQQDSKKLKDEWAGNDFEFVGFTYKVEDMTQEVLARVRFKLGRTWYDLDCNLGNPHRIPITHEIMREKLCEAFVKKLMDHGLFWAEISQIVEPNHRGFY